MLLTYSLSYFMTNSDNHRAAEMYVGELQYSISIDGSDTNILTVPSGETIVDLTLTGLNDIDTYYKLLYTSSNNAVTVKYFDKVQDTSGNLTTYDLPGSSLTIKGSKTLKLKINNASADSRTVTFKVSGGYSTNTLADVVVPSGYYQIGLATQDANAYFCHTSSALTDGLEYTADKLAYKYKYLPSTTTAGSWATSATIDSWGVQLADKTSTESFNGKLCTYIDNKPIKVLSNAFEKSKASSIDISNFNTSNVTTLANLFSNSAATTITLGNIDTSNLINMYGMFYGSSATSLDITAFDTSKVTDMRYMFYNNKAATLNLSKLNTSNVTNMTYMFYGSEATSLDLTNFNTSKVTNGTYMFSDATKLVGGNRTTYDVNNVTHNYARIDTSSTPGYFTNLEPISFSADSWDTIIAAIKKLRNTENVWWLRTPIRTLTTSYYAVDTAGKNSGGTATLDNIGFSPAFRIG